MNDGFTAAYVDGSWRQVGRNQPTAGYGIYWEGRKPSASGTCHKGVTNVGAEVMAAIFAIEEAARSGIKKLRIISDCEAVGDADNLIPRWKANNWYKLPNPYEPFAPRRIIEDRREFERFEDVLRSNRRNGMIIVFNHVRGHSGNEGNNAADRLARR